MDCEFIYAFVPRTTVSSIVDKQAKKKALEIIKDSKLQMEYEDQAIDQKENEEQFKELCEKLKTSKKLWDK